MPALETYEPFVGRGYLEEIRRLAAEVASRRIVMVNSTRVGGGVAEILMRMVPLLNELGLDTRWEVIGGTAEFFRMTKVVHNALHGQAELITPGMFQHYLEVTRNNANRLSLDGDLVFIHDPQPLALISYRKRKTKARWLWRCHIDVSRPVPYVWQMLQRFIRRYHAAIYSMAGFAQQMQMRQILIPPSIDPISDKNRELTKEETDAHLAQLKIPRDLPIVTQVSRFDRLKDPLGVIEAFRKIRRSTRCRLVLAGGTAADDPEGQQVLDEVRELAGKDSDIHILVLPSDSHVEINALQRASAVVLQKSLREGFALTVSEALWKERPVVASAVGGIPLQVIHGHTGLLVHTVDGAAQAIRQLLRNPEYAARLAHNGREHVRENFLLTRHLRDYLMTFLSLERSGDTVTLGET